MVKKNIESITWLDRLPTEILFLIFDYLSNNDILYTFFYYSERLNNLLLQNKRYLIHIDLPRTDLNTWETIFSMIGYRIECLNINQISLSIPLKYFPNLKSVILSSLYGFSDEELKSLVESEQFSNLKSFEIKQEKIFSDRSSNNNSLNEDYFFAKIYNDKNSFETLTIPSFHINTLNNFKVNFNLRSMTLKMILFENLFLLIELTPNLEYLNIDSNHYFPSEHRISINHTNMKLKQFHLTLRYQSRVSERFDRLINLIKEFSSSLICLSLNLIYLPLKDLNEIPFNSFKLQQLVEFMRELREFHLYAKSFECLNNSEKILSEFRNEFWFDHQWSFGMHGYYFYTLPFYFHSLYQFYGGFDGVKSNNPEILINNRRLWDKVKSIQLKRLSDYDGNFLKELKIKMPQLNIIKFSRYSRRKTENLSVSNDGKEKSNVIFDKVTTVRFTSGRLEDETEWLINSLPNLRHLISSFTEFPSVDSRLSQVLNERIERLDIDGFSKLEQLTQTSYLYFSNVHYIHFCLNSIETASKSCANYIMKILINFKNLKTLLIYIHRRTDYSSETRLKKLLQYLDMKTIIINYKVKHVRQYCLFLKHRSEIQDVAPVTRRIPSYFSCPMYLCFRKKRS